MHAGSSSMPPLVSVGLPVRNGADRLDNTIRSVLDQDHARLELVICDNASDDGTEELCRGIAAADSRVVYHRHPSNIGLLPNFMFAIRRAGGQFFRWIGDDDWLAPGYVTSCLEKFAEDRSRVLVTTQVAYTHDSGSTKVDRTYDPALLSSSDPVLRLSEMLRLLNESPLLLDPLYGMVRRDSVISIPRRNMLKEDEIFAVKLALAGPWGHVPEVLAERHIRPDGMAAIADRLDVPRWQRHFSGSIEYREILRLIGQAEFTRGQAREARRAAHQMYARRQMRTFRHRGSKLRRAVVDGSRRSRFGS